MSSYLTVLAILTAMYLNVIFANNGIDQDTAHVEQGLTQPILNCEAQLQQCQSQCASTTAAPRKQALASEFRAVIDNADRVHDDHPFVVYCESVKETFKHATYPFPFFHESNSNCQAMQEKYKGDICAFVNQEFQNSRSDITPEASPINCFQSGARLNFGHKHGAGSVDFTRLPQSLEKLMLEGNEFSGTVDLTQLPQSLRFLYLDQNNFSGTVDLTQLPKSLEMLYLSGNMFSGTVDLTQLAPVLGGLDLSGNMFSGTVDLTQLPRFLRTLQLSGNMFHGTVDLTQSPEALKNLDLSRNKFSGTVDLTQLPRTMTTLKLQENAFVGDLSLTQLPRWMHVVDFCDNKFSKIHSKRGAILVNECKWYASKLGLE